MAFYFGEDLTIASVTDVRGFQVNGSQEGLIVDTANGLLLLRYVSGIGPGATWSIDPSLTDLTFSNGAGPAAGSGLVEE